LSARPDDRLHTQASFAAVSRTAGMTFQRFFFLVEPIKAIAMVESGKAMESVETVEFV
jgi:hypothetical protein